MLYAYVKPDGGVVYPYTVTDFRLANPGISMRDDPDPEALAGHGLFPVEPAPAPDHDPVTQDIARAAEHRGGKWVEVWTVTDAAADAVAERKAARRAGMEVSMRQARLALLGAGMLAKVDHVLASLPSPMRDAAVIEWEYAASVRRDSPLIAQLGPALGLDADTLDSLFETAGRL